MESFSGFVIKRRFVFMWVWKSWIIVRIQILKVNLEDYKARNQRQVLLM
jgi:hypothetical protein